MDEVPRGKTDKDEAQYQKLLDFKDKVTRGRLVKFWKGPEELASQAVLALTKAFSANPQVGWVRADQVPAHSTVTDVLKYREENDRLKAELARLQSAITPRFKDAAGLEAPVQINYTYWSDHGQRTGSKTIQFANFLRMIAPALHTPATIGGTVSAVRTGLKERFGAPARSLTIKESDVQDALLHLVATGHVKMWSGKANGTAATGYQLTEFGTQFWQESSYVKKGSRIAVATYRSDLDGQ